MIGLELVAGSVLMAPLGGLPPARTGGRLVRRVRGHAGFGTESRPRETLRVLRRSGTPGRVLVRWRRDIHVLALAIAATLALPVEGMFLGAVPEPIAALGIAWLFCATTRKGSP